ncbi:MAG: hypothetical protein K2J04_01275 [Lachnospiraceae bacterium]|nr:hypothetical protein [Lachnospiraceae bacterium]
MRQEILDFIWISVMTLIMCILVVRMLVSYFIRAGKYWAPPSSENRDKMKFVTQLSKDEVIEGLRSHKANDIFEYEFRSESDMVYILLIKEIDQFKLYCKGNVTYKLVISSKADNTVVWVVLYKGDNENAIERYGWELKGFMEKKIRAVRVE